MSSIKLVVEILAWPFEIVSVETNFSFKVVKEVPFKNFKGKSGFPSQYRGHGNGYEITSFLVTHDFKFKFEPLQLMLARTTTNSWRGTRNQSGQSPF